VLDVSLQHRQQAYQYPHTVPQQGTATGRINFLL
jgi:hypothetical protein